MIRHAFYEFFLHVHIALVIAVLIALWRHLVARPTQKIYLYIVTGLWAADRAVRLLRLLYRNIGGYGMTCATVQALPGDAVRVTLKLARPWNFRPGQYFFVTIPSVGLWTSHPFSAAWSEEFKVLTDEDGIAITNQDVLARPQSTAISAIIRRRDGFTHQLFKKAAAADDGIAKFSAIVEGPYGLTTSLSSYGTVLLFAGGVGISHQLPYIRCLVTGYASGTFAVRRTCLIWVIQSLEQFEWVRRG
jgi:predicted ferric reductase